VAGLVSGIGQRNYARGVEHVVPDALAAWGVRLRLHSAGRQCRSLDDMIIRFGRFGRYDHQKHDQQQKDNKEIL